MVLVVKHLSTPISFFFSNFLHIKILHKYPINKTDEFLSMKREAESETQGYTYKFFKKGLG